MKIRTRKKLQDGVFRNPKIAPGRGVRHGGQCASPGGEERAYSYEAGLGPPAELTPRSWRAILVPTFDFDYPETRLVC